MSKKNDSKKISSKRIKEVMGNMTQDQFAYTINSSQPVISKILSGTDPSVTVLIAIAEKYGVSVDWILGLTSTKYISGYTRFDEEEPITYSDVIAIFSKLLQKNTIKIDKVEEEPDYIGYQTQPNNNERILIYDRIIESLLISVDSLLKNSPETVDSWLKSIAPQYNTPIFDWDKGKEFSYNGMRNFKSSLDILKEFEKNEKEENKN